MPVDNFHVNVAEVTLNSNFGVVILSKLNFMFMFMFMIYVMKMPGKIVITAVCKYAEV